MCACDRGWPPQKDEAIEHFAEHKSEIEALEDRLLATDYLQVSSGGWRRGSDETPDYAGVVIENEAGRERTRITGEEAIAWNEAFRAAKLTSVSTLYGGTSVEVFVNYPRGVSGFAQYRRPAEGDAAYVECREEFRDVRCGECGIPLDDGWWLRYWWATDVLDSDLDRAHMEGEISWEEWTERDDELRQACWMEGAEIIGIPEPREDGDD